MLLHVACIGYCCELVLVVAKDAAAAKQVFEPPDNINLLARIPRSPLCSYCGTGADVVYHPQKAGFVLVR